MTALLQNGVEGVRFCRSTTVLPVCFQDSEIMVGLADHYGLFQP